MNGSQRTGRMTLRIHPYRKLAGLLYRHFSSRGRRPKIADDLSGLCLHRKDCTREYYVRKIAQTLLLATVTAILLCIVFLYDSQRDRSILSNEIPRPGYGEADLDEPLELSVNGEMESEDAVVHISSRKYTSAEARSILQKAERQLQNEIFAENGSPDEVRHPLRLPRTLQSGQVSAEYAILPRGLIDEESGAFTGTPDPSGTPVTVEAALRLQDEELLSRLSAVLYPPVLTKKQQLQADLDAALKKADEEDPSSGSVRLPERAGDSRLSWGRPKSSLPAAALLFGLLLPALFWAQQDEKVRQAARMRKQRLSLDYSELLFQLTLLLGAGLTIRGAFTRICAKSPEAGAASVRKRPPQSQMRQAQILSAEHPVYDEIRCMLREISGGVPEETAYENFGRRCGLPEYIKLGSLLAQNLRKGSRGLVSLLEKEAFLSLQQHRTAARKLGEKASMRMLLPMILMLADVMIILMVPALLNM